MAMRVMFACFQTNGFKLFPFHLILVPEAFGSEISEFHHFVPSNPGLLHHLLGLQLWPFQTHGRILVAPQLALLLAK